MTVVSFVKPSQGSIGQAIKQDGTYITTLVSPNHPDSYPPNTQVEWIVATESDQMVWIDVKILSIEHVWDTVTVHHVTSDGNMAGNISLVSSSVTSLLLPGGSAVVSFCSDAIEQYPGFVMEFTSYSIRNNETVTSGLVGDTFICQSGLEHIRVDARCDGIVDCHDFSDEIGCKECDLFEFHCNGSGICLLPRLQCDGRKDCPHGEDEMLCGILRCPPTCSCGESYSPASSSISPCVDPGLMEFWVNCTDGWNEDYLNATAPMSNFM